MTKNSLKEKVNAEKNTSLSSLSKINKFLVLLKVLFAKDKTCFTIFPISIILMELVLKLCTVNTFFDLGLLFMPLFSVSAGLFVGLICSLFKEKINNFVAKIFLFLLALIFSVQTVYHWCFDKYLILYSVGAGGTGQIIEEGIIDKTISTIEACILPILFYFAVAVIGCILITKKRVVFLKRTTLKTLMGFAANLIYRFSIILLAIIIPTSGEIYSQTFDPNLTVGFFGLMTTESMDLRYNILGVGRSSKIVSGSKSDTLESSSQNSSSKTVSVNSNKSQVMNFDFKSLAANETDTEVKELHDFFSTRTPTNKNEYTGKYSGYNLIYITAEGFSPYAIDKELTPTLYKMYNKGYKFTNFYTPIWGVSTSDGEYVNCTGLIPKSGVWSFYRSGAQKNNMYFTMGRQFLNSGTQKVYAYHNHTYSYYHRDVSHPNMGYTYKGYGNGLENSLTKSWPESDLEMIEATADEYITSNSPFHAYYMTVSGHMDYTFTGNAIARKNRKYVESLNTSETVKAYYACNIELDRAMKLLLDKLEAAGVAEKTLIVISPDHYPYGLEDKESENKYHYIEELAGHSIETNFELYKSVLLMYCPEMTESVTVDKYCSSLDILPTLSNLFGFEYDSRLLMGKDIFSDSEQLVVFSNRSFITNKGMYNSQTRKFTSFDGSELNVSEEYLLKIKKEVNNMFVASAGILDCDYYGILFGTKTK